MNQITFTEAVEIRNSEGKVVGYCVYPIRAGVVFLMTGEGDTIKCPFGETPEDALENAKRGVIDAGYRRLIKS